MDHSKTYCAFHAHLSFTHTPLPPQRPHHYLAAPHTHMPVAVTFTMYMSPFVCLLCAACIYVSLLYGIYTPRTHRAALLPFFLRTPHLTATAPVRCAVSWRLDVMCATAPPSVQRQFVPITTVCYAHSRARWTRGRQYYFLCVFWFAAFAHLPNPSHAYRPRLFCRL